MERGRGTLVSKADDREEKTASFLCARTIAAIKSALAEKDARPVDLSITPTITEIE